MIDYMRIATWIIERLKHKSELSDMLDKARIRGRSNMSDQQAFRIGVIITIICGMVLLFCVYLYFFGGSIEGVCTKSPRSPKHHYDIYTYTIDGKEYWMKINVSKVKESHLGETKTIQYFPAQPMVTFDPNMVWLSAIGTVIGVAFIFAGRKIQ